MENNYVSRDEVEGNIRIRGKTKLTVYPLDLTLSVYYFMILTNFVLHTELSIC